MTGHWPHTGAVLVGGSGSRMGTDKSALVLPSGRTMLEHITRVVASLCSEVVSVGDGQRKGNMVADLRENAGPLAGIEALLASGLDDQYLVVPTDTPLITAPLLGKLVVPTRDQATIFVVKGGEKLQSLPIRISAEALPIVSSDLDRGKRGIHQVIAQLSVTEVELSESASGALANVNSPEDYAQMLVTLDAQDV